MLAIYCLLFVAVANCFDMAPKSTDVCSDYISMLHSKDHFADPNDCHNYYQCFILNETTAVAIPRSCPKGFFWRDPVMACLPEGKTPCHDHCLDDAMSAKGCYAGTSCRHYFVCSNKGSHGMCCPDGTKFEAATCSCVEEPTCHEHCTMDVPVVPTAVVPPTRINSTVCKDSFGATLSSVEGEPNAYKLLDSNGQVTEKMYCAQTTDFNLSTCRCDIDSTATLPTAQEDKSALFWANFDQDLSDHSSHKFATFPYGDVVQDSSSSAQGSGSLHIGTGGHLSVPGLRSFDFRNEASFSFFFKCQDQCKGGILSNFKSNNEYTVAMGVQPGNNFVAKLNFWHPIGSPNLTSTFQIPSNGWNHATLTYDGNEIVLYLNGKSVDSQYIGGYLAISSSAYFIGRDPILGNFVGNVDEIIMSRYALSAEEVAALSKTKS